MGNEKQATPISVGDEDQHITCTSTPLSESPGSRPEAIDKSALDALYLKLYGHPVSSDPAARIIQHEQAIARHKRLQASRQVVAGLDLAQETM